MRRTQMLLLAGLVVVLAWSSAAAETPVRALGAHGEVFTLLAGAYGDIAPEGNEDMASSSVLALRIERPDGTSTLSVVPATFGPDLDTAATLVLEPESNRVFLMWQSWSGIVKSRLLVAGFDGAGWTEPIEVSDDSNAWKSSPVLLVTRDDFRILEHGVATKVQRTVVHVVWSQEVADGGYDTVYAPIVLEAGRYLGVHPVVVLNELDSDGAAAGVGVPFTTSSTSLTPYLRSGGAGSSVVAAFLDMDRGRISAVELNLVPGELNALGDVVADTVLREGELQGSSSPAGVTRVVDQARHQLIDLGSRLEVREDFLDLLAAEVEKVIRERAASQQGMRSIAAEARHQLIDLGARLSRDNLRRASDAQRHQLIDLGVDAGSGRGRALRARVLHRERPIDVGSAPPVAADQVRLFCSRDGKSFLVAWVNGRDVEYRETRDADWSPLLRLALGESMTVDSAYAILESRISSR